MAKLKKARTPQPGTVMQLVERGHRKFRKANWAPGNFITLDVVEVPGQPIRHGPWVSIHAPECPVPLKRLAWDCGLNESDWLPGDEVQ